MKTFKHSGAFGDLLYGLPMVKHFGGGEFYLHLDQMNWIGQHYYGSLPTAFHQGRMTRGDFAYMQDFMLAQDYIESFEVMDPKVHAISHNLDKFRPPFVGHPANYIDVYSSVFGLSPEDALEAKSTPWLTVPNPKKIEGRNIVVSRSQRWIPGRPGAQWLDWTTQGFEHRALFVGLPEEYTAFRNMTGWDLPYYATSTMLEVASVIAGADMFIGNQSSNLALAIGIGVPNIHCEARVDMPLARNECYFPEMGNITYF
jgi:hypothetical protein